MLIHLRQLKIKNIISAVLILVMVLQLVPMRQAVKYFMVDNITVEDLPDTEKDDCKKFEFKEDHKYLPALFSTVENCMLLKNKVFHTTAETLPQFHFADVHTPPPNF